VSYVGTTLLLRGNIQLEASLTNEIFKLKDQMSCFEEYQIEEKAQ